MSNPAQDAENRRDAARAEVRAKFKKNADKTFGDHVQETYKDLKKDLKQFAKEHRKEVEWVREKVKEKGIDWVTDNIGKTVPGVGVAVTGVQFINDVIKEDRRRDLERVRKSDPSMKEVPSGVLGALPPPAQPNGRANTRGAASFSTRAAPAGTIPTTRRRESTRPAPANSAPTARATWVTTAATESRATSPRDR